MAGVNEGLSARRGRLFFRPRHPWCVIRRETACAAARPAVAAASAASILRWFAHMPWPAHCLGCQGTAGAARLPRRILRPDRRRHGSPQPLPRRRRTSPDHGDAGRAGQADMALLWRMSGVPLARANAVRTLDAGSDTSASRKERGPPQRSGLLTKSRRLISAAAAGGESVRHL